MKQLILPYVVVAIFAIALLIGPIAQFIDPVTANLDVDRNVDFNDKDGNDRTMDSDDIVRACESDTAETAICRTAWIRHPIHMLRDFIASNLLLIQTPLLFAGIGAAILTLRGPIRDGLGSRVEAAGNPAPAQPESPTEPPQQPPHPPEVSKP